MKKVRIIARIDVKNEYVIKGIHLEGLRKLGNPNEFAKQYYLDGIDEIIFMDAVASYYDRNSLSEIIDKACKDVFVPITVGGGIRKIEDIQVALNSGADKVAINTQAVKTPEFITEASKVFGSQCLVASIQAKRLSNGKWEVYTDNGREPTGLDVEAWAVKLEALGAGEIMVTSIDSEGTKKGFDISLVNTVCNAVNIPVIASGGAGNVNHLIDLTEKTQCDAISLASVLHYKLLDIYNIKKVLNEHKVAVRI